MNREQFERRLDRLGFAPDIRKGYEQTYDNLQRCSNITAEVAESKAAKLQFTAFVAHNRILLTEKAVREATNPMFVRFPVKISDNLVDAKCFKRAFAPQKGLRILGFVSVYCPADEHERPVLSLVDIARQLPDEFAVDTKAVCLLLEDCFQQNSYNLIFMQYEYKIMLLG